MLLRSLFLKTLRDLRGQILGWGLGVGSLALLIAALYPAFRDQMGAFADLLKSYPPALMAFFGDVANMTQWLGWLGVEFFSWVPPILLIFAVGAGTGLIAGEEEAGTLDLLLSQPIRRWRVVAEKLAAFAAAVLLICLLIALCLVPGMLSIGQTQGLGRTVLATFEVAPITLASGSLALMASVIFRRRRLATGLAAVVTIGSWFLDSLGKVVDVLKPYRPLAIFHYYGGGVTLTEGLNWGNVGVLLGLALLFALVAMVAFQRRDLAV